MTDARTDTLLRFAARRTPRYTSYPTAPHFHAGVDGGTVSDWLERLPADDAVSLYLHIPYCHSLCWYCGCNTSATTKPGPVSAYVDQLLVEIERVAERLPARMRVSHLAFGGGTPTILSPDDLARIMDAIRARFDIEESAELSIEIDPRRFSAALAGALGRLGFTRASTGIQTFDPKVQKAINRMQSLEVTRIAFDRLRDAGVAAINADVLYGLPHQTVESSEATARGVGSLAPARLAVFGYAHVPHMMARQRVIPEDTLPGPADRLAQADAMDAVFLDAGFRRIGIDHYARPDDAMARAANAGTLRRNFQGYTTDAAETLIGIGASSISRTPFGYAQNESAVREWGEALQAGGLPVARGVELTAEDRLRGAIIEALMTDLAVDLEAVSAAHDQPVPAADLDELRTAGVVSVDGARVRVNPAYRQLARLAAAAFDARLASQTGRHSVSV